MPRLPLYAVAFLSALGGCAEEPAQDAGPGDSAPPPREAPAVVTEADAGRSFALPLGSETTLRLSGEYVWSEPRVRGGAVRLVRVDYFQDPGFSEWLVEAVEPGTVTIAAAGRPACADGESCPEEPARFEVTLTVSP